GYIHYEVSNFARGMKYASRHNQKYWDHSPYLGLGPSAHSFQPNRRWWNHRSLDQYLAAINAGNLPVEETESLTMEQLRLEALYLGLGTSAHSFQSNRRWWNHRSLDQYLAAINAENLPVEEIEILTMEQMRLEALYLAFRTKKGVSLHDFKKRYQYDLFAEKKEMLNKLQEEGFISIRDGRLYPTQAGLAVADSLALI
ncbi:MAG: hypothetical protein ACXWM6_13880, partial [Thermodesulfobacteriota bacterium]